MLNKDTEKDTKHYAEDIGGSVEETSATRSSSAKARHVYAVIYKTPPRHCIPYFPEEHEEEVLELYEELEDANNRVRREWEEYGDALGWDVEVSFDGGRNMWRVKDYEGLSTGVRVSIKECEVKMSGSEPAPEPTGPVPSEETCSLLGIGEGLCKVPIMARLLHQEYERVS
ncbi:hypothetical protein LHYA1_G008990 [Lachnellula hyalina]|uniref:Uncharacterized protein n=1 Tax=Lachnellula hyalina TaxID=1316788 RepID=A0A8H8TUH3_9HELO|nr:uncharacterized protein LHYA1_G008990 [Lachnellula hyalina]TVY22287.1 hypothetical protein LHYA1_G008990 [Lachnellula hyalina]